MRVIRSLVVGRKGATGVDIALDDLYVAARHCRISQIDDGTFVVENLSNTNGTFIVPGDCNLPTTRVCGRQTLQPGDRILVGRTTLPWRTDSRGASG
jgi:pSer/pThr/pTyr-binding forkhead associated (FHA) protein